MSLGARIRELRTLSALSQAQLAEKIGVNTSAVSLWENDVNEPKASYIARLALALDVSADYLLGIEDEAGGRVRVQPQARRKFSPREGSSPRVTSFDHSSKMRSEESPSGSIFPQSSTVSGATPKRKRAANCIARSTRSGSSGNAGEAWRKTFKSKSARPPSGSITSPASGSNSFRVPTASHP